MADHHYTTNPYDTTSNPPIGYRQISFRVCICAILLALAAEIFLRLFITAPSRQLFDPELGWKYIPGSTLIHSGEGYALHTLNEQGMNDSSLSSKVNQYKVLVSGDSFVEALEVDRTLNFVSQLATKHENIDFINSGRGDFTPMHQLVVLDRLEQHLELSLNLFFLSVGDIGALTSTASRVSKDTDGNILNLQPINPSKDAIKDKFRIVLHHSALATYFMRRYHVELKGIIKFIQAPCLFYCDKPDANPGTQLPPAHKTEQAARLDYILKRLNDRLPTIVFYIPTVFYQRNGEITISAFSENEISMIEQASDNQNIRFHNLAPLFKSDYRKTGKAAFGFHNTRVGGEGHLNAYGHKLVARYINNVVEFPK